MFLVANHPEGASMSSSELIGRTAIVPIFSGQVILSKHLGGDVSVSPSALIPEGRLAYGLPIDPEQAVGGFIGVGDRVDVYSTSETETALLLSNILIIGIAGEYPFGPFPTPGPGSGNTSSGSNDRRYSTVISSGPYGVDVIPKIFILDLTSDEALLLADAKERTIVSLALHSSK